MAKIMSRILTVCLCLIFGLGIASYAEMPKPPAKSKEETMKIMQTHMEKMKIKNPAKYEAMLKNAGGNVTECRDCHKEVKQEKKKP